MQRNSMYSFFRYVQKSAMSQLIDEIMGILIRSIVTWIDNLPQYGPFAHDLVMAHMYAYIQII